MRMESLSRKAALRNRTGTPIQVHYLPASRDPTDHISYSANALLGRALRSADWSTEREEIGTLTEQISNELTGNAAIGGIPSSDRAMGRPAQGRLLSSPSVSFGQNEIENLTSASEHWLRAWPRREHVDFARLSDGQQSLLYVSLVLAMHNIGSKVLSGELAEAFDIDKLRPAVFTLIAIEEPENSFRPIISVA